MLEKLKAEGSGILNWALEGYKIYQQEGLKLPEEVQGATKEYRVASDVCEEFLRDRIINDGSDIGSTKLYQAFKYWFLSNYNQRELMSQISVSKRLNKLSYKQVRRNDGRYFQNIGRIIQEDHLM